MSQEDKIKNSLKRIFGEGDTMDLEFQKRWSSYDTLSKASDEELERVIEDRDLQFTLLLVISDLRGEEFNEVSNQIYMQRRKLLLLTLLLEHFRRTYCLDRPGLRHLGEMRIETLDSSLTIDPVEFIRGIAMHIRQKTAIELGGEELIEMITKVRGTLE